MFFLNVSFLWLGAHFPNITNNYSAKWFLNPHPNVKMLTCFVVFMTPLTKFGQHFLNIRVWQIYKHLLVQFLAFADYCRETECSTVVFISLWKHILLIWISHLWKSHRYVIIFTFNELFGDVFLNITPTDLVPPCLCNLTPSLLDQRNVYFSVETADLDVVLLKSL